MVKLSPAEYSYLRTSLESTPPVRPDARAVSQFRPLQAATNFLPNCYGSARVRTADGGECIVGIKAKVVRTAFRNLDTNSSLEDDDLKSPELSSAGSSQIITSPDQLIKVNVDMSGTRDDDASLNITNLTLQKLLQDSSPVLTREKLRLNSRFSFMLFIDALVISHQGNNPLNLLSLAIYLALLSTRLPKLISSTDDSAAAEIPVFDDDWSNSVPLSGSLFQDNENSTKDIDMDFWKPPLLFVFAIIGDNILIDPSIEEEAVADGGFVISWQNGKIIAPIRYLEMASASSMITSSVVASNAASILPSARSSNEDIHNEMKATPKRVGGITLDILKNAYKLALEVGTDVSESLDLIVKLDQEEEAITGPPTMF